jgi:hypothetical protein
VKNCRVSGAGLKGARAGEEGEVVVTLSDEYGNRTDCAKSELDISLQPVESSSAEARCCVSDNGDGSFSFRYSVLGSGQYALVASLGGVPIPSSPLQLAVTTGLASPELSEVVGLNATASSGEAFTFSICAKDRFGTKCVIGGDSWDVLLIGPTQVHALLSRSRAAQDVNSTFSPDSAFSLGLRSRPG